MVAEPRSSQLRRLFTLLGVTARMDLLWLAQHPASALTWFVSELLAAFSALTSTFLVAARFDGIGRWSKPQVVFLLGFALLVRGVVAIAFGMNIAFISRRIGRGQLDHMLLAPQPLWLTLLTDGFTPVSASGMLIASLPVMAWATHALQLSWSWTWLAWGVLQVLSASALVLAFTFIWGSLAFYAPRAAEEINSETMLLMTTLGPFPLDGMGSWLTWSLLTAVPAGFIAWLPSRALLGLDVGTTALLWTPLAACTFGALAIGAFRRGLAHYRATGSTRYSAHGHRR